VAATALLVVLGRRDGCSWTALGLGRESLLPGLRWAAVLVAAVLLGYLIAVALPPTRQAFADTRATSLSGDALVWRLLVRIPFGTALLEEVAFRGVLYAMVERRRGVRAAIAASSVLFGLWHVLPSMRLPRANAAVADVLAAGTAGSVMAALAATAGTALAGAAFCELRRRSGGLVAPFALHWALNALGLLVAWLAFANAG
jgi:uncharacterized protein